jgi:ADP-heptose:LPS heptosyltransferase
MGNKNRSNFYVFQHKGNGLGNFIMCTPTIITLHQHYKQKITVHFSDEYMYDLFKDWDVIEATTKTPSGKTKLFGSNLINQKIPDWQFIHNTITKQQNIYGQYPVPHTYVPCFDITEKEFPKDSYVVLIRGCFKGSIWASKKNPGDDIYNYIMKNIPEKYKIVLVGNGHDFKRDLNRMSRWDPRTVVVKDDIRKAVSLICGAKFVVSNDTGLYHVAGAINKDIFVIWKQTPKEKNRSPGVNCFFSKEGNWKNDFNEWVKTKI